MKKTCVLLLIFLVSFFVFSADKYTGLMDNMYPKKATATMSNDYTKRVELSEPSVVQLTYKELAYHTMIATRLMEQCGNRLTEKKEMFERRENYGRALYKIKAYIEMPTNSNKARCELIYYIYTSVRNNPPAREMVVQLNVVCIWEKNNEAILNLGFKEACTADNNWLHWGKKDCPNIEEIELKLKKAFNNFGERIPEPAPIEREQREKVLAYIQKGTLTVPFFITYLCKKCFTASKAEEV